MDNLANKPLKRYDGSVNISSNQQTFNMNHIYIHTDMLWLYYQ